ncbi:hypothetical protein LXL04_024294 [Taraxacum kok-saghyz]
MCLFRLKSQTESSLPKSRTPDRRSSFQFLFPPEDSKCRLPNPDRVAQFPLSHEQPSNLNTSRNLKSTYPLYLFSPKSTKSKPNRFPAFPSRVTALVPVFAECSCFEYTTMDDVNYGNRDDDDDGDCVEVAGVGEGQSKETGKCKRQKKQTSPTSTPNSHQSTANGVCSYCCLSILILRTNPCHFLTFRGRQTEEPPSGPTSAADHRKPPLIGDQPQQSLTKLAKIHGPIMFLKLGRISALVISSAAAAKEVLQKQDLAFSTRFVPDGLHAHNHSLNSVVWIPVGHQWRTLRRILTTNIFAGNCLDANQHLRHQKVQELVAYCRKASETNESVDIGRAAFRTSLNLLSNTIFSKDLTDPFEDSGKEFREVVGNIMMEAGKPNLVDYFPVLKKIDPQGIRRRMTRHIGKVLGIFEELIKERLLMKRSQQEDVLDVCLKISEDNPEEFNREVLKSLFLDLFVAGTDTTSSTLEWAMTEILCNQHIMEKAKAELEERIGKGAIVEENDLIRIPYLVSIVKETLRMHPPIPFLVPRKFDNEIEISGYTIPEGTQVLVNAWAIGRDETFWEDSLEFKPERFMTTKIDVGGQDFELIPFGAGRRMCPGIPLATRMVPMMLGSLLNNFDWVLDTFKYRKLDMTERSGITIQKIDPLCVVPIALN